MWKDMGGNLIEERPNRAVGGKISHHRVRPQLIANPGHGQVIPIKAKLWNEQAVGKDGNCEQGESGMNFFHEYFCRGKELPTPAKTINLRNDPGAGFALE